MAPWGERQTLKHVDHGRMDQRDLKPRMDTLLCSSGGKSPLQL